jgi:hypothetical protein
MPEHGEGTPKRYFVHTSSSSLREESSPCSAPAFRLLLRPKCRTLSFTRDDVSCRTNPYRTRVILSLLPARPCSSCSCSLSRAHPARSGPRRRRPRPRSRCRDCAGARFRPFVASLLRAPLHLCANQIRAREPVLLRVCLLHTYIFTRA